MPLEHVHIGIQTVLAGDVHHAAHIRHALLVDPSAIRLQIRPDREDAHMVHTQFADLLEIVVDAVPVRVEPCVEPAMRRRVVDSEFHWSISFFPVRSALESALFQATEEVALEAAEEDDDRDKRDERTGGDQSRILDEHALESVHAEGQGVLAFIGDRD